MVLMETKNIFCDDSRCKPINARIRKLQQQQQSGILILTVETAHWLFAASNIYLRYQNVPLLLK
jgi:hypothetical protein